MTRTDYQKKAMRIFRDFRADAEQALVSFRKLKDDAKVNLPPAEFTKLSDWLHKRAGEQGLGPAFCLVSELRMSPAFVAQNLDAAQLVYQLAKVPIGNVARDILRKRLPAPQKRSLNLCKYAADLFVRGLPYALPDGSVKFLRAMTLTQQRAAAGFVSQTSVSVPRTASVISHREHGQLARVIRVDWETVNGQKQAMFVCKSVSTRTEFLVRVTEAQEKAEQAGIILC